jgi:hypothetical protein
MNQKAEGRALIGDCATTRSAARLPRQRPERGDFCTKCAEREFEVDTARGLEARRESQTRSNRDSPAHDLRACRQHTERSTGRQFSRALMYCRTACRTKATNGLTRRFDLGLENRYPSLGGSRVQIPPPPLDQAVSA